MSERTARADVSAQGVCFGDAHEPGETSTQMHPPRGHKKSPEQDSELFCGAGDEIRTHDIYLGKVTLYP